MTSALLFPLPAVSADTSSHESLWECHTAGGDLGTDGVGGEDAPALLNSLDPLGRLEMNGIDGRGGEIVTLSEDRVASEPEEGRSPVEEAGHEVEGAEDEELGSTVEEGEEAALALGAMSTDSDLPWLPMKQAPVDDSGEGRQPCESGDDGASTVSEHAEASTSVPGPLTTEASGHCQPEQ